MGACVSSSISCDLVAFLASICPFPRFNVVQELRLNIGKLEIQALKLRSMAALVRRDSSLSLLQNSWINAWLEIVDSKLKEVDATLLEKESKLRKMWCGGLCVCFCCCCVYAYGRDIDRLIKEVMMLIDVNLSSLAAPNISKVEMPLADLKSFDGFDKEIKPLIEADGGLVLGLYGVIGIGKTTMLKYINNMVLCNCDSICWFDAEGMEMADLQNALGKRMGIATEDPDWTCKDTLDRSCAIYGILKTLKFAILIDNLCFCLDFTEIGIPLPNPTNKAKVIFTTSNSKVRDGMSGISKKSILRLKPTAAWELFKENNERAGKEEIKATAEKVVELCQGRPKTLVTVARALAHVDSPVEWRNCLEVLNACGSRIRDIHFPEPPLIDEAKAFLQALEPHMENHFSALGLC